MKKILYIFFLIVSISISTFSFAQQKSFFTGKVTDAKTGAPLVGAAIFIHDANKGAVSDNNGVFKTATIAAGKYLVEISFTGYESIIEQETINGTTEKNFALQQAIKEQEGVTVTGVSSATRLRESVQPVAILKRDDLVKTSSTNIINSLTHIAGVSTLTTGPAISKPFIRGLGYNRVVTINDGVRQEGQQWGDEHGIEIDDYSAQRVEVLKGPASLMYGSDAIAGVINIQSLVPAPEGLIKANLLSEYQTNARLRGFYGGVSGTKNGFSFGVYGSYKAAADYKNKYDGYVFNSKFNNRNVGGMLGYSGDWGHSYISVTNFDQHIGMVEGERDAATGAFVMDAPGGVQAIPTDGQFKSTDPFVPYQHIEHFKVTSDNGFNIGKNKLDVIVGYQHNKRKEFGDVDAATTPDAFFDLQTVSYAVRWHLPAMNNFKTSFGVTGMVQTNENKAADAIIPDYTLSDMGGFVFSQYHKDKLTVSGGLRFDNRHVDGKLMMDGTTVKFSPFTNNFSNVSGSIGATYEATKNVAFKLNVARGFRAPAMAELASNGAHEGTNRYEVGDNNLKSETSFQVDGGVSLSSEHVSVNLTAFYNNISNFIFYRNMLNSSGQDSVLIDPVSGNALNVFKFTSHDAHLYGLEFNVDIHPHPLDWLHFENTFSFTRAQFSEAVDGSKDVPLIPAARYISELKATFKNFYASVEGDYTFKQNHPFTGYGTETATDGYLLLNATVGKDFTNSKGKKICSLILTGTNLGDVAYQNHLSRLKYTDVNNVTGRQGVFNMGRNIGLKLNVPLDFKWN